MAESGLVNNYTNSIDAKNRVFFPAKFREDLGSPIVITVNVDKCLSAYSMNEWNNYTEKLKSLPKTQVRQITRVICGNAIKAVPDGQGRVMLTKELLDYADIKDNVTFIGCGDRVEMWPADRNPLKQLNDNDIASICEQMIEFDL